MYLKNLTVLGFKSFADKTALNFLPGVTCIVGPNGCGKSNVSDAIRWVLGEQSAKALRGGEMADVIFNGTESRKALGMAEVSLTIGGFDSEHLKAAGVEMSYNEVTITRRVFRDGGSEYFINRTPCRLRDIQQLFMGTGVGRTSYSIMAQGNITQILSSKPEDRRLVFEEAAGITKFKSQKKEALRKLEYTEQNLLRVSDLVREVKRQIGSLQRQAGKARRYKQLSMEMQHLDTQLARHEFDQLQADIRDRQDQADRLREAIEAGSEQLLRKEDEIVQLRTRLGELEHEVSIAQQRGLELKGESERHESRIQFNEERLRELAAQNAKALQDINEAVERQAIAQQELDLARSRLEASQAALEQLRANLDARRADLQRVEDDLRARQEALRQAQSEAFGVAQQLTRVRNEFNALELQKQGNVVRLEKLSTEKVQLEEERGRLEVRLQEFAASVEAEKVSAQMQRGTVEERQQRLREIQQQLGLVGQELDGLTRRQAEMKARLQMLEQLQTSREGFSAGALAALRQSQAVLGPLSDRVRVPDEYVTAIEAALGGHLQMALIEQPEAAREILNALRDQKKGKASIAPLALRNGNGNGNGATVADWENAKNWGDAAVSVVETDEVVRPLVKSLLGHTLIVNDLETAARAWQECHGQYDFVTRAGEMLSRHGVFTGGYTNGNGKGPSSILGRKNQIAELTAQVSALQGKVEESSRCKGALQAEQTGLQASLQQAQTELRAQEVAIATRQGEFNALQNSLRVLHQKIDTVVYEIQCVAAQEKEGLEKRSRLAGLATGFEEQERALQQRIGELGAGLDDLRLQRDAANTALTEAKVAAATEEQLCASYRQQQGPLEQRIRELGGLAAQRRQEIGSFGDRQNQATQEIAASQQEIERLAHQREQVNIQAAELISQKQGMEADIAGREEDLRNARKAHSDLQQQKSDLEVELAQKRMAAQNLKDRVRQKYQVNLDDIRSECITITYADEGPARVEVLSPEEMAAAGVATDWAAVAAQVAALQQRLDEMGPVNLVAIEEYEETEQRYKFLSTQHDDLVKAKEQLTEVINRINVQTKEMFTETFNRIRENFVLMFTEVFGGGKADLRLVDEGDVLESGIEIVARPPGKQLQSISLLSGGEQTMTAVALLFSIYQVKPSPFCVLDELDAPLDESNINRFVRILQRFLQHSQFVIITHNKRTIGMADVLYGVTMQERGVSKVVSVKFHKTPDEKAADHRPQPLEKPVAGKSVEEEEDEVKPKSETVDVVMAK